MLKEKKKKVWRRQRFLPQGETSFFQAVQQIEVSQPPCIRSLRAPTRFMLSWETVISLVCQIISPHLWAKTVCCAGASFLVLAEAFSLLLPARWGALCLPALCPPASPGALRRPAHPSCARRRANPRPNKLAAAGVWARSHVFSHLSCELISHIWFPFAGSFYSLALFQTLCC